MPKERVRFSCIVLLGCCLFAAGAHAAPATMPTEKDLSPIIKMLDDPDPDAREEAQITLMSHPLALPQYEAAVAGADVSPQIKAGLEHCIRLLKPGYAARLRNWNQRYLNNQWNRKNGITAYLAVGHRDPKWDKAAITALQLSADVADGISTPSQLSRVSELCRQAIAAGCDDAEILFTETSWESLMASGDVPSRANSLREAAEALQGSKYSPYLAAYASADYVAKKLAMLGYRAVWNSAEDRAFTDKALELLPQCAADKTLSRVRIGSLAQTIFDDYKSTGDDPKRAFDRVYAVLEKALPNDPSPLIFRGNFYIDYAWAGRGGGYANTVNDAQWKDMKDRLVIAREALLAAYKLDPHDSRSAASMINVELGESNGRDQMEIWFKRAMDADPDNMIACRHKLYYLEPKWYGSRDDMLAFGRECMKTENWAYKLPLILVEAHQAASKYLTNPDDYFKDAAVWTDVHNCYSKYLIAKPTDYPARSTYALLACKCGELVVADQQFRLLGNHAVVSTFGDKGKLDEWRAKAAQAAKDAAAAG